MNLFKILFGRKDDRDGEPPEFKAFLEGSVEGLQIQTDAHRATWRLGYEDRWDFAQDAGELIFTFSDKIAVAPAQIIGTFDGRAKTWMWSWTNSSILETLTRDAVRVQEYGKQHNIPRLITPQWPAKKNDGWQMAALANRLCNTNGAYRGPAGKSLVFFTFGEVRISKQE